MNVRISHPKIIEMLAKSLSGDEGPFPRRSGPSLVNFFNKFGYNDVYGSGFPTRWRYAEQKLNELVLKGKLEEVMIMALSVEELVSFNEVSLGDVERLQSDIIEFINSNIFNLTDRYIVKTKKDIKFLNKTEVKPLGEGFFAEVYPWIKDGKKYAIKKLKPEFWSDSEVTHRFKREFELMGKYNTSKYTISVYEFTENDNSFLMEFADYTLKEFINEHHHIMNLQWQEHICEGIMLGLMEIHPETIHRDLSYNNVLMIKNEPKLADFGLGKDSTKNYSYKTVTEKGVGTAHFTDPIQLNNIKDASIQTDIYSLGKLIDYIFNGSVVSREHKYSSIVARATNRDLSRRYQNVNELHDAFVNLKNTEINYDPMEELMQMVEQNNIVSEKIYNIFTRKNAGIILTDLILTNYSAALEVFEVFSMQYEHELEKLLYEMFEDLKERKLSFANYDNFGRFSMRMLEELGVYSETTVILSDLLEYVGFTVNRFSIQRLINENRNNKSIPSVIRNRWDSN
ncbi:protein kinase domain-containing protein [Paenibacillus qinlingensis]|uniref:protein kinase domain-containing protein n=1 Tax=Paenibacillus qinlingensis TaxID=1837343 RepID=UPI00156410BF|nr:protein kinase [Paenibacillus qinlingensis]NQX62157.1 protein kinase [Paenibacillus qinlingensis]